MKILAILAAVAVTAGAGEWPLYSQWRNDWATQTIYMTDGFVAAVEIEYPGADLVISNGAQTVTVMTNIVERLCCADCEHNEVFHSFPAQYIYTHTTNYLCDGGTLYLTTQLQGNDGMLPWPYTDPQPTCPQDIKLTLTTVKEIRELVVWYAGEPFTILRERVLSAKARRQVRHETWQEAAE